MTPTKQNNQRVSGKGFHSEYCLGLTKVNHHTHKFCNCKCHVTDRRNCKE